MDSTFYKTLDLTIPERMRFMELLPERGIPFLVKTVRQLSESLSLDKEIEDEKVETKEDVFGRQSIARKNLTAKEFEQDYTVAFDIHKLILVEVRKKLQELEKSGSLQVVQVSLYEKIIGPIPQPSDEEMAKLIGEDEPHNEAEPTPAQDGVYAEA